MMPDISMCANPDECPVKYICHRANATPNQWGQSYSKFEPEKGKECGQFWYRSPLQDLRRDNEFHRQTKE